MVKRTIRINNVEKIEDYLELENNDLIYIDLEKNLDIPGVEKLIKDLPETFEPKEIKKSHKKTGLNIQAWVIKGYDMIIYDRNGRYPREDANIWNSYFVENVDKHPEWLEPQEEADIIILFRVDEDAVFRSFDNI